jgi:hypothetical protein
MTERHDAILADCVRLVAVAWVASWRDSLRRDGRVVRGGWPGTVSEARAIAMHRLLPELAKRGLSAPSSPTLERASHEIYTAARRAWLDILSAKRSRRVPFRAGRAQAAPAERAPSEPQSGISSSSLETIDA